MNLIYFLDSAFGSEMETEEETEEKEREWENCSDEVTINLGSDDHFTALKENTIDFNQIQIRSKFASGQFGDVYKGMNDIRNHEYISSWLLKKQFIL